MRKVIIDETSDTIDVHKVEVSEGVVYVGKHNGVRGFVTHISPKAPSLCVMFVDGSRSNVFNTFKDMFLSHEFSGTFYQL